MSQHSVLPHYLCTVPSLCHSLAAFKPINLFATDTEGETAGWREEAPKGVKRKETKKAHIISTCKQKLVDTFLSWLQELKARLQQGGRVEVQKEESKERN